MKLIHRWGRVAGATLLYASIVCASSPQILPINPALDVTSLPSLGAGRTLSLEVVDARTEKIVGYRDPSDNSTAITTAPEMLENITRGLEMAIRELGFEQVAPGTAADVKLDVRLVALDYRMHKDGLKYKLKTGATFDATSVMPSKTVTGTYRDGQTRESVIKPSLHKNAEILNAHVRGALLKLVSDTRLISEDL